MQQHEKQFDFGQYARLDTLPRSRRRKKPRSTVALFVLTGTLLVVILFIFRNISPEETSLISPLARDSAAGVNVLSASSDLQRSFALGSLVHSSLSDAQGTYGIYIKNLNTGETYGTNEHRQFQTASLYKLWTMAVVFEQIRQGRLDEDDVLADDVVSLNKSFNIASESAERSEGSIRTTVNNAVEKMITISDNYSALILTKKIKLAEVTAFLQKHHFTSSRIGTATAGPVSTAYDIGLFFEKLQKNELADKATTEKMLTLLKKQRLNSKIPKYLPEDIAIAHKTGELFGFNHDAGIIYAPRSGYIFVMLSETNYPPGAIENIAELSKSVYEYFQQEKVE